MKTILHLFRWYTPLSLRNTYLHRLHQAAARAFGTPESHLSGRSYRERLQNFARLTRSWAENVLTQPHRSALVRDRLFEEAYRLGSGLRAEAELQSRREVCLMIERVYAVLGIRCRAQDNITLHISSCSFSRHYTADTCRLMCALDEGLVAGLSDGGTLVFVRRFTEGHPYCEATLRFPEDEPCRG